MNAEHEASLQALRYLVRDKKRVPPVWASDRDFCIQPARRTRVVRIQVFLQITCDDAVELPVPGQIYFRNVKAAQRGGFSVLADRGPRAAVHLGSQSEGGFSGFAAAVQKHSKNYWQSILAVTAMAISATARRPRKCRRNAGNTLGAKHAIEWWVWQDGREHDAAPNALADISCRF